MALSQSDYVIISYAFVGFVLFAFALYAMVYGKLWQKTLNSTAEGFLTARGTQGKWRIAWSFYAGAVGCWAIVTPPAYAAYAGVLGLAMYSIAAGFPLIFIAWFGGIIRERAPHVGSFSDFAGWRFGPCAQALVVLVCLTNMSIALCAEYTTIGSLFQDFVGSKSYPIIIVVGALTTTYTAYGGLVVSIVTDQVQAIFSIVLVCVLAIYIGATFREPLPTPLTPELWGLNSAGYSSIFTMPASLLCATFYSEVMWQRVWASDSQATLYFGSSFAAVAVALVIFFTGWCGFMAQWAGLITDETNPNLYLFQVLPGQTNSGNVYVNSWIGVIVLILAATMNESAVDSMQNGLAAALGSFFLRKRAVMWSRIGVLFINVPLIVVGINGGTVLQLFLLTNMICCCFTVPIIAGLIHSPWFQRVHTETSAIFGGFFAAAASTAYGIGWSWDPNDVAGSFYNGANLTWLLNGYAWDYFLVAITASVAGSALWIAVAQTLAACGIHGPGITGLVMKVPGLGRCCMAMKYDEDEFDEFDKPVVKSGLSARLEDNSQRFA